MKHIEESLSKAEKHESKLTVNVLDVPGFTSLKIRHFLNNLCSYPGTRYLEIGMHKGATLISAMYQNEGLFIGIDNFSSFNETGDVEQELLQNINRFNLCPIVIADDCWKKEIIGRCPENINIYFYDGEHDYDSQRKALNVYYDKLAKDFVFIVDDWNWDNTRDGTLDSLTDKNIEITYEKQIFTPNRENGRGDHWWNGVGIFGIKKL